MGFKAWALVASGLMAVAVASAQGRAASKTEPLQFKGVPLGAPKAQFFEALPEFTCERFNQPCSYWHVDEQNVGRRTFAGEPMSTLKVQLVDGNVGRVSATFDAGSYERIKAALQERYGKPDSVSQSVAKNLLGAALPAESAYWSRPNGILLVAKRFGNLTTGALVIASKAVVDTTVREAEAAASAAKKDI